MHKEDDELNESLERLRQKVNPADWKYCHFRSIENFIYHLNSFDNERTKSRMIIEIRRYLELVDQMTKEEFDRYDIGKELFSIVWRISRTYKDELGFIQRPSILVTAILAIVGTVLFGIIINPLTAITVSVFCVGIYLAYAYFKIIRRKFF